MALAKSLSVATYCIRFYLCTQGVFRTLNLDSSNGDSYFASNTCSSETEFWIVETNESNLYPELRSSALLINHSQPETWNAFAMPLSLTPVFINGQILLKGEAVDLKDGDQIKIKYANMTRPINLFYQKCNKTENETTTKLAIEKLCMNETNEDLGSERKQFRSELLQEERTRLLKAIDEASTMLRRHLNSTWTETDRLSYQLDAAVSDLKKWTDSKNRLEEAVQETALRVNETQNETDELRDHLNLVESEAKTESRRARETQEKFDVEVELIKSALKHIQDRNLKLAEKQNEMDSTVREEKLRNAELSDQLNRTMNTNQQQVSDLQVEIRVIESDLRRKTHSMSSLWNDFDKTEEELGGLRVAQGSHSRHVVIGVIICSLAFLLLLGMVLHVIWRLRSMRR